MNALLVNQNTRHSGDFWTVNPLQGVPMCPTQRGLLLVPHPAIRRCSPPEVIDLVNDDSSVETPVNQVAAKPSEIRKRKLVIVILDDDTSLETARPPFIEIEDSSLGSMSWDGGSLSFLDGLKDSEMPPDFEDDDVSAIVVQACSEASAVVPAPQGSIDADGLFGRAFEQSEICTNLDVDSFLDFQQHSRATATPPAPFSW
jgi:hypothetical protein